MPLSHALFILLQFFVCNLLFSQSDDSVRIKNDSSRKQQQEAVVEYRQWRDSVSRERLLKHIEKNGKSLDAFLAEMKEKEEKKQRQRYVRIGLGAILLLVLMVSLARSWRRKNRT